MKVTSEIAQLKKVILHRPFESLKRLTPDNCDQFLFDDVLWPERAAHEHDLFASVLRENGVEVYLLDQLLKETLENEDAKIAFIHKTLLLCNHNTKVHELLTQYLSHLTPAELVKTVLGGMTFGDVGEFSLGLCSDIADKDEFIIPPLPNHMFTRDTSFWIGNGVAINHMAFPARQGETANLATIYKHHPMFVKEDFNIWLDGSNPDERLPSIEGGDVLVISDDCVLIGLGQRTKPQAVELLAKQLFKNNAISKIIAIELPRRRASMHLDTLMTMLNQDTFAVAFPCLDEINAWQVTAGNDDDLVIEDIANVFDCIAHELGVGSLNLIYPSGDSFAQQREQWTDSSNLLAIKPGTVIGYECNVNMNKKLKNEGIDVIPIAGSELGRGRGGSRCMSCPILRED